MGAISLSPTGKNGEIQGKAGRHTLQQNGKVKTIGY